MPEERTCPPHHVEYGSEGLADNAVILHGFAWPNCPGIERFPCGDHFHIGHKRVSDGQACRMDPVGLATQQRIRNGGRS